MDNPEQSPCPAKDQALAPLRPTGTLEPAYDARALTGGGPSARILLGDQVYSLRITRAGKLILTK